MALTDPQKFKENTETEVTAPRISTGDLKSVYRTSDGLNTLTVSLVETSQNRKRHLLRIDISKLATNIYEESKKQEVTMSCYLVVDRPDAGFTVAEALKAVKGLVGLLSASSYSIVEKALGGEN